MSEIPDIPPEHRESRVVLDEGALRSVLKDHYLQTVVCNHEMEQDNPVCNCSTVHLGWHPSIGEAVDAWVAHVMDELHYLAATAPHQEGEEVRQWRAALTAEIAYRTARYWCAHPNMTPCRVHRAHYDSISGRDSIEGRRGR